MIKRSAARTPFSISISRLESRWVQLQNSHVQYKLPNDTSQALFRVMHTQDRLKWTGTAQFSRKITDFQEIR